MSDFLENTEFKIKNEIDEEAGVVIIKENGIHDYSDIEIKKEIKEEEEEIQIKEEISIEYNCFLCHAGFQNQEDLMEHLEVHNE